MPSDLDNPRFFCGEKDWAVWDGSRLSTCFIHTVIINGVDYLGLLFSVLYYILALKKYHNFNGKMNKDQRGVAFVFLFIKLLFSFVIAFGWVFTRLDAKAIKKYPMYLTISDNFHLITWFAVVTVTYLEWNRSLPHSWFLRGFWWLSCITDIWKFWMLVERRMEMHPGEYNKKFIGNIIIVTLHCLLALMALLGIIPFFRKFMEADFSLAHRKKGFASSNDESNEGEEGSYKLFLRNSVNRSTAVWLGIGFAISVLRGYLLQLIYKYFGAVFDSTNQNDPNVIISSILSLVGVFFGYATAYGISSFFWGIGAEKVVNGDNGIRNRLFKNVLRQEVAYYNELSTGVLVSRFSNDAERVKRTITDFFPVVIESMGMVAAGLWFLFATSWTISLYLCSIVPLTYAVSYYQAEIFELFEERNQSTTANMTGKVQDVFSKVATVLIYNAKNTEKKQMWKLVRDSYSILRNKAIFSGVIITITEFLSWLTTLLGLFMGVSLLTSYQGESQDGKLGLFVTFAMYSINVIKGIILLLKTLPRIGETLGASREVLTMIDREPEAPEDNNHGALGMLPDLECHDGEIELKDVVFSYPKTPDKIALDGVNLKIAKHSKVALVGDSGAGKSTILHMIGRFFDTKEGQVLIDGQELKHCNTHSIRDHLAIVSQDCDIFALSILENILYGRHIEELVGGFELVDEVLKCLREGKPLSPDGQKMVDEAYAAAEAAHAMDFVQGELHRVLGEGGKGLSGGQKQRLTIARALYKNPKILLLDEVTSALDPVSEKVVQEAIDRLTQNRTVVIVAHRLHTIKNADKIVVLEGGRIVAEGDHDRLMQISRKYRELVEAAQQSGGSMAAAAAAKKPKQPDSEEIPTEIVALFKRIKRELDHSKHAQTNFFPRIDDLIPELQTKPSPADGAGVGPVPAAKYQRPEFGSVRDYYELLSEHSEEMDDDGQLIINNN